MRRLSIPADVSHRLAAALARVRPLNRDPEPFLDAVGPIIAESLPPAVVGALQAMGEDRSPDHAVVLAGLVTVESLPATPRHEEEVRALRMNGADGAILGVSLLLGEPVGYAAEKGGLLVQHVFPVPSEEQVPSNESSLHPLDLHTEIALSRDGPATPGNLVNPDFLVLSCLRPDPAGAAATVIVDGRELCRRLPSEHLDVLRQLRFEFRAPYSFTREYGSRPRIGPAALIAGNDADPALVLDLACGTRALDAGAERALAALRQAAQHSGPRSEVRMSAGDVLVIDNRHCLHGRSSFRPTYDGRDRWLQRVYVRRSLPTRANGDAQRLSRIL